MHEELESYINPEHISYADTGTPGYKVPVIKSVLSLRPKQKASTVDLDAMWEIIKELAGSNASASIAGEERCIFCNAKGDYISNLRHKDICIISKAYKLVWQKENEEWHERRRE